MLTTAVLVPNHRGVSLRCDRDEFRMRHVKLPIIRQHQLERLERPRCNESFQRCEIHATTVLARVKVSISRLAPCGSTCQANQPSAADDGDGA